MKGINRIVRFPWVLALAAASAPAGAQVPPLEQPAAVPDLMQLAYLKASNAEAYDHFGCGGANTGHSGNSVAISRDGSTLAIGAPYESSGATGIGGDQGDNSLFSAGAAGDEDCLTPGVNPPGCDNDSPAGAGANIWVGAAYAFARAGRGEPWTEQAFLKAANARPYNSYGVKLALSGDGDTLAVAAYLEDEATQGIHASELQPLLIVPNLDPWRAGDNRAEESGAVYLYSRTDRQWTEQVYVKASNAGAGDEFGSAVALSGDGGTLVVGAHQEDGAAPGADGDESEGSASDSGAVYVFGHR